MNDINHGFNWYQTDYFCERRRSRGYRGNFSGFLTVAVAKRNWSVSGGSLVGALHVHYLKMANCNDGLYTYSYHKVYQSFVIRLASFSFDMLEHYQCEMRRYPRGVTTVPVTSASCCTGLSRFGLPLCRPQAVPASREANNNRPTTVLYGTLI